MLKTKNKHLRYVITFFAVLCSSLLQTFVIESFVHSAGLLSGGFTGVAILIDRAASLYHRLSKRQNRSFSCLHLAESQCVAYKRKKGRYKPQRQPFAKKRRRGHQARKHLR